MLAPTGTGDSPNPVALSIFRQCISLLQANEPLPHPEFVLELMGQVVGGKCPQGLMQEACECVTAFLANQPLNSNAALTTWHLAAEILKTSSHHALHLLTFSNPKARPRVVHHLHQLTLTLLGAAAVPQAVGDIADFASHLFSWLLPGEPREWLEAHYSMTEAAGAEADSLNVSEHYRRHLRLLYACFVHQLESTGAMDDASRGFPMVSVLLSQWSDSAESMGDAHTCAEAVNVAHLLHYLTLLLWRQRLTPSDEQFVTALLRHGCGVLQAASRSSSSSMQSASGSGAGGGAGGGSSTIPAGAAFLSDVVDHLTASQQHRHGFKASGALNRLLTWYAQHPPGSASASGEVSEAVRELLRALSATPTTASTVLHGCVATCMAPPNLTNHEASLNCIADLAKEAYNVLCRYQGSAAMIAALGWVTRCLNSVSEGKIDELKEQGTPEEQLPPLTATRPDDVTQQLSLPSGAEGSSLTEESLQQLKQLHQAAEASAPSGIQAAATSSPFSPYSSNVGHYGVYTPPPPAFNIGSHNIAPSYTPMPVPSSSPFPPSSPFPTSSAYLPSTPFPPAYLSSMPAAGSASPPATAATASGPVSLPIRQGKLLLPLRLPKQCQLNKIQIQITVSPLASRTAARQPCLICASIIPLHQLSQVLATKDISATLQGKKSVGFRSPVPVQTSVLLQSGGSKVDITVTPLPHDALMEATLAIHGLGADAEAVEVNQFKVFVGKQVSGAQSQD